MTDQAIRVLLVEDSPSDALLIQQEMSEAPGVYVLTHVERVDAAIAKLRAQPFDVILTDLNLPDSSGFATFQRLQAHSPDLPLVVLTGLADETAGIEAIRLGVQDYLIKGQASGRAIARIIRYGIERKATAKALRESESKYRNLFENMTEEVHFWRIVRDNNGGIKTWRLVDANPPTLRTWGRNTIEEIRGKTTDEIFGPGATEHFRPVIEKIMSEGTPHSFEDYFPHLDRHFRFTSVPLGEYFITTGADITKIKKVEDELRNLNETLEERVVERTAEVQQLADQLRLLASELTLAEQRERRRLATVLHDGLQQILVASRMRLARLTNAANQEVRQRASEVSELLSESIEMSRSLTAELSPPILHEGGLAPALEWLARWALDKQGLEVELEIKAQLEPAAEELNLLLFQATRELLFNIVKHAGVKTARVQVAKCEEMIEVTVSDEGAGFDPSQLALKRDGKSGGFGLFSIRERLGLLGGRMEVHSSPGGSGSRFVLLAPLPEPVNALTASPKHSRKVSVAFASPQEATDGPAAQKLRVMLVDDHQVMRQGLSFLIRDEHDLELVGEASDGDAAIHLARELHPDVILMDVSMPRMSGLEATRIIHGEMPEIQIIGLSMFEEQERAEAMKAAGAVNYLTKSGPSAQLIAAIRACAKECPRD